MGKGNHPYKIRDILRAIFRNQPHLLGAREQDVRAAFAAELIKTGYDTEELPNDIWRASYHVKKEFRSTESPVCSQLRTAPPRVASLELVNFRQFKNTSIKFPDQFAVLAGANNSGKTTILWAIKAFFQIMRNSVSSERGGLAFHNRYVKASDFMPVPNDEELWYNKSTPGSKSSSIRIRVTFTSGLKLTLVMLAQFGQIHVSCEELPAARNKSGNKSKLPPEFTLERCNIALNQTVDFIPGLVGVLISEPYVTPARRESLAAEGRYTDIFRSSLIQLRSRDSKALNKLNAVLEKHFNGVRIVNPVFEQETNEFVDIRLNTGHTALDIVNAGSGLQQVVQIMAYLYLTRPTILLVDEPDAHLHPTLQQAMGGLLREVGKDLGAQVLVSTHSYDLIDTFPYSSVLLVDSTRSHLSPLKSDAVLRDKLIGSGLVANSSLLRIFSTRRCLVLEDSKKEIYKAIDMALGFGVMSSWAVRSAKGVDKFEDAKSIVEAASGLLDIDVDFRFLQDQDGLSPEYATAVEQYQHAQGLAVMMLKRHEIENYLLDPDILITASKNDDFTLSKAEAEAVIIAAGKKIKQDARSMCRDRHLAAVRFLPLERIPGCTNAAQKPDKKETEKWVDGWFDSLPDNVDSVLTYYLGKELMQSALQELGAKFGQQFTQTQLHNALTAKNLSSDIKAIFRALRAQNK